MIQQRFDKSRFSRPEEREIHETHEVFNSVANHPVIMKDWSGGIIRSTSHATTLYRHGIIPNYVDSNMNRFTRLLQEA